MWQGIQAITEYKAPSLVCNGDASLQVALNDFYAQFEAQNSGHQKNLYFMQSSVYCVPLYCYMLPHGPGEQHCSNVFRLDQGMTETPLD